MPCGTNCREKNGMLDFVENIYGFQQNQITRFVLAVITAKSKAIFPKSKAFPPIMVKTWNPIGIVIAPNIAIPNIIAGNIRFRRLLRASPATIITNNITKMEFIEMLENAKSTMQWSN